MKGPTQSPLIHQLEFGMIQNLVKKAIGWRTFDYFMGWQDLEDADKKMVDEAEEKSRPWRAFIGISLLIVGLVLLNDYSISRWLPTGCSFIIFGVIALMTLLPEDFRE